MNRMLLSVIRKEFIHIVRDPQTLVIVILMPLLMLFLYGYAITLEMKEIATVIVDQSRTPESRAFIDKVQATHFFKITDRDVPESGIDKIFFQRKARCVIVIPFDFARNLVQDASTPVQLLIDASDPNAANYILKYLGQINARFNEEVNRGMTGVFSVEPRILYNPDFKSSYFFIPGLVAVIVLLISALLTSIAIVREKETGTMEQILVSPVRPGQLIVGKLIPYLAISLLDSLLILVLAHVWFKVPMNGSGFLLLGALVLYILTGLSFGLLISTATRSQQVAMMATLVVTILPSFLLSGFIFPVRSMPLIFRGLSQIVPATHFLIIIRAVMLKGVGVAAVLPEIGAIVLFSAVLILISIKKFNLNLE